MYIVNHILCLDLIKLKKTETENWFDTACKLEEVQILMGLAHNTPGKYEQIQKY